MVKKRSLAFFFGLFFITEAICQEPVFKDGDKICFIGSSIAMNGANYHYINLFYATRYPDRKITFLNSGISGDITDEIIDRMDSDILANHPTWAVMMLEENDLRPSLYYKARENEPGIQEKRQKGVQNWFKNADSIIRILRNANVKVILQTPTIYDQTGKLPAENAYGINDSLHKCVAYLKELAEKYKLPFVDCWTVLNEINKQIQRKDISQSIVGNDRLHISKLGHFIMAEQFLKAIPVRQEVSHVSIDAKRNKLNQQINCSVTDLKATSKNLFFTYKCNSLPLPSPDGLNVDSLSSFTNDLNADILQVNGLTTGNYQLLIDKIAVGTFSDNDFKNGINLSRIKTTPQYQQAGKVLRFFNDYWDKERTLRVMKYVELVHVRRLKSKNNMEEIKKGFDEILENSKQDANYSFFRNVFNTYLTNKPNEKEMIEKSDLLLQSIQEIGKPLEHTYSIVKI